MNISMSCNATSAAGSLNQAKQAQMLDAQMHTFASPPSFESLGFGCSHRKSSGSTLRVMM